MTASSPMDSYSPREIASRVEGAGVTKAGLDALSTYALALLAGAFITLGGLLYTVVVTDSTLGFGVTKLIGGLAFCLGLILVVLAGAELFTGNNLVAIAWASGKIRGRALLRNWILVYAGNVVGALGTTALILLAGVHELSDGEVGRTAVAIAKSKAALDPVTLLARGILCNALVCLAVWLAMGGRTLADRLLAVLFPITAFVAVGFEHSIANWFFLPYAMLLMGDGSLLGGSALNLAIVTIGNVIGGTLLVAGVYWFIYLRPPDAPKS